MNEKQMILIGVLVVIFIAFLVVVNLLDNKSLNGIKAKKVGNGQHGTARWATKAEIKRTFIPLPFEPEMWRKGQNLPTVQGTVVGCRGSGKKTVATNRKNRFNKMFPRMFSNLMAANLTGRFL